VGLAGVALAGLAATAAGSHRHDAVATAGH
jgi:hypothetical protein